MKRHVFAVLVSMALSASPLVAQGNLAASHAVKPVAPAPATRGQAPPPLNPSSAEMKKAVVRVNGVAITAFDLFEQTQRLFPYYQMHGGKVPEKYQQEIHKKAIDQLISDELVYQDAKRKGMTVSEVEMQKVIKDAVKRLGSRQEYQQYAKTMYGSVEEFQRRLRRARLIAEYQHREIELKSKVADEKMREIYDQNPKMFEMPERVRFQTITVNVPENASEAQKKLARKRIDEITPKAKAAKNYEEFGVLAEQVSEDDYRVKMGDHDFVPLPKIPVALVKPIAGLKPGELSDIVETPIGYILVRVEGRMPAKKLTYEEIKGQIREQMETMAAQKRWATLSQQLRKSARIEVL